jgi:hypothetical protein
MSALKWAAAGLCTALASCAPAPWNPYETNGQSRSISPLQVAEAIKSWELWQPDPLAESTADKSMQLAALSVIARGYLAGDTPPAGCNSLKLMKVNRLPLGAPIAIKGKPDFVPTEVHEHWDITACGQQHRWLVGESGDGYYLSLRAKRSSLPNAP